MKQLQGLLAFVEAATTGSLTAAAERLEVTPAAVSKSLARLEAQLGVRLLNRSTRRLSCRFTRISRPSRRTSETSLHATLTSSAPRNCSRALVSTR